MLSHRQSMKTLFGFKVHVDTPILITLYLVYPYIFGRTLRRIEVMIIVYNSSTKVITGRGCTRVRNTVLLNVCNIFLPR